MASDDDLDAFFDEVDEVEQEVKQQEEQKVSQTVDVHINEDNPLQKSPQLQPQHYHDEEPPPSPSAKRAKMTSTIIDDHPDQIKSNWTTHKASDGKNYYYNKITKRSTYTRPACVSDPATAATQNNTTNRFDLNPISQQQQQQQQMISSSSSSSSAIHNNVTTSDNTSQKGERGWTQHTDKASGKIYYYNGVTTTWDKPKDFISTIPKQQKGGKHEHPSSSSSPTAQPKNKKRKKGNNNTSAPPLYSSKAEAIAAFKGLLLAKDISPTMKWNDVVKICSSSDDVRWNACSSIGERKQALAEYQSKRAAELREQKRKEKVRAKDAFMSLLTDKLPHVRIFNPTANTRFEDIRDSLSTDDRFYAVEDEDTRHELYFDFVEELRKREERQRRGKKREAKDLFVAFLKNKEEIGSLTFASTWSSFTLTLSAKDKEDPRFLVSSAISDSDRQLYFADYVLELNAAEEEKKRRIQDARRRAEKAQRDAYREDLRRLAKEGTLLPSSRWRNCEDELSALDSFGPVNEQDKNAPRDMFEDFVYDWADDYRRDKSFLNNLVESHKDAVIKADTEFDDFKDTILQAAAHSPEDYSNARRCINDQDPVSSAKLYFDEIVLRAKNGTVNKRRTLYGRPNCESSEDEGEIVEEDEEGEVSEQPEAKPDTLTKKDE